MPELTNRIYIPARMILTQASHPFVQMVMMSRLANNRGSNHLFRISSEGATV